MSNTDHSDDDEILLETAQNHREAALHFQLASKHHIAAAEANAEDDAILAGYHAYAAYGHQVCGIGHAKVAAQMGVIDEGDCDSEGCDCD